MPRGLAGTTTLLGTPVRFVDGPSFVAQWQNTFVRKAFRFVPERSEPLIIIDVGANVGVTATYWLRDLPGCRVVAIEADPDISEVLDDNIRAQGFDNVEVVNAAVAATRGTAEFAATGTDAGHLERTGGFGDRASMVEVSTVPLSDFLSEPVDLLKVDIEGAEGVVLEAAADQLHLAERIFVEFHHFVGDDLAGLQRVLGILDDAGFSVYMETEGTSAQPFVARDPYCDMDFQLDLFGWREVR